MPGKILFLDDRWDTEGWKQNFDGWLPEGVEVVYEKYGFLALQRLEENPDVKLVFLDMQFEGQDEQGEQILKKVKEHYPDMPVVILTSVNDAQLALRLVHDEKKAYYYFFKDGIDSDQITKTIENAIEKYDLKAESIRKTDVGLIVGESRPFRETMRLTERASQVDSTVLITGETGTGKELIARAIHLNSRRKSKPCVIINCATIPEELVESELFGHMKGSFTSAYADKRGRFELAHGGTIFLDEVAEMSPAIQVKLLRAIQQGEIQRIGSDKVQTVDVRIIAATNRDLDDWVDRNMFRADLFYRLNVLPIQVPPLRSRRDDIPLLVDHILRRLNNRFDETKDIAEEALDLLKSFDWPGNVRQLENALEQALVNSTEENTLRASHFDFLTQPAGTRLAEDELIRKWVEDALHGASSWEDIRREFGVGARKKVMEGILSALRERGRRPTGNELARLLKTNRNYVNQIIRNLGLQLKET
jgi:two-component system, NtrC family, response regulator HydG